MSFPHPVAAVQPGVRIKKIAAMNECCLKNSQYISIYYYDLSCDLVSFSAAIGRLTITDISD
ncbi:MULTISPECIES: hypothetical protein [unclassified Brucella]|uniref:hypothetical protein n=1 Tax=unclassified Brucella TaxID=2632610 RepID=UPI000972D366|nr:MULTISPECIES: hypothetical protein [unclassified Brucella]APX70019.1 hypothetical protein BKD03_12085 [Brucella sp. 09RB8471]